MLRSSFFFVTKIEVEERKSVDLFYVFFFFEVATTDAKVVENLVSVSPNLSSLRLMWAGFSEEICFSLSKLPSLRSLRVQFYPNPKWRQAQGETVIFF